LERRKSVLYGYIGCVLRMGMVRNSSQDMLKANNAVRELCVISRAGLFEKRTVAFQWFFTAFSVLPGIAAAMSAHRLPIDLCASTRSFSSCSLHAPRLMSGLKWLFHRSRHCLPVRPGKQPATALHFLFPCVFTRLVKVTSSVWVQPCRPFGFWDWSRE